MYFTHPFLKISVKANSVTNQTNTRYVQQNSWTVLGYESYINGLSFPLFQTYLISQWSGLSENTVENRTPLEFINMQADLKYTERRIILRVNYTDNMLGNVALTQTRAHLNFATTLTFFKKGIYKPSYSVSLAHSPAHVHVFCVSMHKQRYVKY